MIGHINGLASYLFILEQVELNHDHVNFVAGLVRSGPGNIFQSILRVSEFKPGKFYIFTYVSTSA